MAELLTMNDVLSMKGVLSEEEVAALGETPFRFAELIEDRSIFLCRFNGGQPTVVGRHFVLCLRAICCERPRSAKAQALYNWLSDNQGATFADMLAHSGLSEKVCRAALEELQQYLAAGPIKVRGFAAQAENGLDRTYVGDDSFLWGTDVYLFAGIVPGARYDDIGYCMQELKAMLGEYYSEKEMNRLLYFSA